jgi:hypothetical protein
MKPTEIIQMVASGQMNMLESAVASVWCKAIQEGDQSKLNFILDRSRIGKVKEVVDHNLIPKIKYRTAMSEDGRMIQELLTDEEGKDIAE